MLTYSFIGLDKVGGYNKLETLYMEAIPTIRDNNSTCGFPPSDAFHVLRDPVTSDQPWPGLILQASLGCLWYWCCDQVLLLVVFTYALKECFIIICFIKYFSMKRRHFSNSKPKILSKTFVKVFRIIPEFRILRLTFHRN